MQSLLGWDEKLFLIVNGWSGSRLDGPIGFTTFIGASWVLLAVTFLAMAVFDRQQFLPRFTAFIISILTLDGLVQLLKIYFARVRPYEALADEGTLINVIFSRPDNYSFPSGHTALAFAASVVLNFMYPKLRILYFLAAWVGFTRVYVGVHYPLDVLGGAVIGIIGGVIAVWILQKKYPALAKR